MAVEKASKTGMQPGHAARLQFPFFATETGPAAKHRAYLDSAASAQKPGHVIDVLTEALTSSYSNIHRGAYALSGALTERYEEARARVARFLGARDAGSIVFVRGTTEAVNLVSYSMEEYFQAGDTILLTLLEHHSNIVPWQLLAERRGLKIAWVDIDSHGRLDMQDLRAKLSEHKPRLVAVTQLANSLGTVVSVDEITKLAHAAGALTFVDGAQGAVHLPTDVGAIGCDFYAFSGHKLYGPTGVGALYIKPEHFERMRPFHGGGNMIRYVSTEGTTYAEAPYKFEAGTTAFPEAIALAAAIEFLEPFSWESRLHHEENLMGYAWEKLSAIEGMHLYGPKGVGETQCSILSFTLDGVHPHDMATCADEFGVQMRAGHHCAMPTWKRLGVQSTARISFGIYSVHEDIDLLTEAVLATKKRFR